MVALFAYKLKSGLPRRTSPLLPKGFGNQRAYAFKIIYVFKNLGRLIIFLRRFTFAFTAKYLKCAAGAYRKIKNPAAQSGKRGIFRFFVF